MPVLQGGQVFRTVSPQLRHRPVVEQRGCLHIFEAGRTDYTLLVRSPHPTEDPSSHIIIPHPTHASVLACDDGALRTNLRHMDVVHWTSSGS